MGALTLIEKINTGILILLSIIIIASLRMDYDMQFSIGKYTIIPGIAIWGVLKLIMYLGT